MKFLFEYTYLKFLTFTGPRPHNKSISIKAIPIETPPKAQNYFHSLSFKFKPSSGNFESNHDNDQIFELSFD
jgi:hypothetical protein